MRYTLSLFVFWVAAVPVAAQQFARHVLKAGVSQVLENNWTAAYELRFTAHSSLEAGFEQQIHHQPGEYGLFNGELVSNYAVRQVEKISLWYPYQRIGEPQLSYLGEGRPLREIPRTVALESRQYRLGYRFSFSPDGRRWRYFLQPGLALTQHSFFTVSQQLDVTGILKEEVSYLDFVPPYRQITYQNTFQQRRTMLRQERWVPGVSYSMGLGYRIGRRFLLETQVIGLFNPETPYEAPQPAPVRILQARAYLHVGVMLGKMRGLDRPKKNWQPTLERM